MSNIYKLSSKNIKDNNLYIMREDLIPYSFGGNKARKAKKFFEEIEHNHSNWIITYGSASSNHCRVVANLCAQNNLNCTIITTEENEDTFNRIMCGLFKTEIVKCEISDVKSTIQRQMEEKKNMGYNPYFIQGRRTWKSRNTSLCRSI